MHLHKEASSLSVGLKIATFVCRRIVQQRELNFLGQDINPVITTPFIKQENVAVFLSFFHDLLNTNFLMLSSNRLGKSRGLRKSQLY